MRQRLCALVLLLGLLLQPSALAGGLVQLPAASPTPQPGDFESWLLSLPLIDQQDMRYFEVDRYVYFGETFANNGCGPAAVANGLILGLGLTAQQDADDLLADLIPMLKDTPWAWDEHISIDQLERLTSDEGLRFTAWQRLRAAYPGRLTATGSVMKIDRIRKWLAEPAPSLMIGRFELMGSWAQIAEICHSLYEQGQRDALIVGFYLLTGSVGSDTPFYSRLGHYETLCVHVGTFEEEGRVYLIDSFRRAISYDEEENWQYFNGSYPFVHQGNTPFNNTFSVERLSNVVLRLSLREEQQRSLRELRAAAEQDPEAVARLTRQQGLWMETVELYGATGFLAVTR